MARQVPEQELLLLERRYWQAIKDKDVEAAMALTSDPCIVAGAQGVGQLTRKKFENMLRAANYTIDEFDLQDAHVEMLSDDVGVVTYRVHEELTVDGEHVSLDASDSSTWVLRDGRWVCALHTEALAGDPFGRDRKG